MSTVKRIFSDEEIVEFCRATRDTNEIHDPEFMKKLGKRVIVPGMFALSYTANLSAPFLKFRASYIKILFSSLLSSGDFVTLTADPVPGDPDEIRLSAINHKDTLTSKDEITRISSKIPENFKDYPGILRKLEAAPEQIEVFRHLIHAGDPDIAYFLFAVAFASQVLLVSIAEASTEVEKEIDTVINGNSRISPFYHSLEIIIPQEFPKYDPSGIFNYFIHFEREKAGKLYTAYVRCESGNHLMFRSRYRLMGISDLVILRMAKDIGRHRI